MSKLVYFDISSDFGFFKKPDINNVGLTYNLPPKPAILGMLGSILGMGGLNQQYDSKSPFPEFYEKLQDLKIGIMPVGEEFPFNKTMNKYNSFNSYFSNEAGGNAVIEEQILIKPKYRIYVFEENENHINELIKRIKNNNYIFMPYLGKNEFIACFDNLCVVNNPKLYNQKNPKNISTIFLVKDEKPNDNNSNLTRHRPKTKGSIAVNGPLGFRFIENYPLGYLDDMHYDLKVIEFAKDPDNSMIDFDDKVLFEINQEIIYLF